MGPAARARAAQLEAGDAPPPAADAFWSEDSAALHDAVQAPPGAAREPLNPPVGSVEPAAGQWQLRLPGLSRLPGSGRLRLRWALFAIPAVVVLVLATIGFGEQSGTGVTTGHTGTFQAVSRGVTTHPVTTPSRDTFAPVDSASVARYRAAAAHHQARRGAAAPHQAHRAAARSHTRAHGRKRTATTAKTRHSASTSHHSAPAPARTEASTATEASAPSQISTGTSSTPVRSPTPAPATASNPSTGGSSSAPPPGPTGIGSMTDGCTVKCS